VLELVDTSAPNIEYKPTHLINNLIHIYLIDLAKVSSSCTQWFRCVLIKQVL